MSKKDIRKALESRVKTLAPIIPRILYVNDTRQPREFGGLEYLRCSISFGRDNITETGDGGRIERDGRFLVGVFTEIKDTQDRNDDVVALVRALFPVDDEIVRNGTRVNILTVDDGQSIPDASYLYSPVYVNFMVWRAN